MNCTRDKTFEMAIPPDYAGQRLTELISGKETAAKPSHPVGPAATVIFWLDPRQ